MSEVKKIITLKERAMFKSMSTKVIAKGMCGYRFSTKPCEVYNSPDPEDLRYIKEKKGFSNNTEMWEWISSEVDSMLKWECVKDEVRESL
mgnify:CR=1 FL=1